MTGSPHPSQPGSGPEDHKHLSSLAWLAAVVLLAWAGLQWSWQPDSRKKQSSTLPSHEVPATVITGARLQTFNESGRLVRDMSGDTVEFFDHEDRSVVTSPAVTLIRDDAPSSSPPWHVTANQALLLPAMNRLELQGEVTLWSDDPRQGRTSVTTEQLIINTDRRYAETDKAVTISYRNSQATAIGLKADLAGEHLILPSRVRETHVIRK